MIPTFIYGTAWKEEATERLTRLAIDAGFRAIDTANQRRHYVEAGVGAAVAGAIRDGVVRREELFLQTKFTSASGQDHRMPFDPKADPATQVRQSFASSLEHLHVESIDSYVLHGPSRRRGLSPEDVAAWRAISSRRSAASPQCSRRSCRTAASPRPVGTLRYGRSAARTASSTKASR